MPSSGMLRFFGGLMSLQQFTCSLTITVRSWPSLGTGAGRSIDFNDGSAKFTFRQIRK